MIAYLIADARFKIQVWWLILTRRGHDEAPESLHEAYDRVTVLYNQRQNRRKT